MSSAGQKLVAGRIPGERIDTIEVLADSADFSTTETAIITDAFPLIEGRVYWVEARVGFSGDTIGNVVTARLRLDTVAGTQIAQDYRRLEFNTSFRNAVAVVTARHAALASGDQTFVVTGQVEVGTGNARMEAAPARPCFLYVDYIEG